MRRADFRKKIDAELRRMGYEPGSWIWQTAPARLTICIAGKFRDIPIKANMKKEDLAYQLGRLSGWAEMMKLCMPKLVFGKDAASLSQPLPPSYSHTITTQIDLEEAIAATGATA